MSSLSYDMSSLSYGMSSLFQKVEFWIGAEHEGWLMKQGDHIKTWRRRWFVLKEGRMFWFKEHRLSAKSVSRGIIRLREIMEIKQVDSTVNFYKLIVHGWKFTVLWL